MTKYRVQFTDVESTAEYYQKKKKKTRRGTRHRGTKRWGGIQNGWLESALRRSESRGTEGDRDGALEWWGETQNGRWESAPRRSESRSTEGEGDEALDLRQERGEGRAGSQFLGFQRGQERTFWVHLQEKVAIGRKKQQQADILVMDSQGHFLEKTSNKYYYIYVSICCYYWTPFTHPLPSQISCDCHCFLPN